ncbi:MAG: hypothetical protein ACFHWX_17835 [Bacteroidota bacterium]
MDIQSTKLELIRWLSDLQDPEIIEQLKVIKTGKDWWDEIGEDERLAIDQGLDELNQGHGIPHEEVMQRVRDKLNQ